MLRTVDPDTATSTAAVWAYHAHPEVWVLVAGIVAAYVYMVRVIGPEAVRDGSPVVTRKQLVCFVSAMTIFWAASDWPMHDIAENYLYSAHMLQHMMMSYFLAPLALLAMPEWMIRTLIGSPDGRVYRAVRFLTKPIVAGLVFNGYIMITHIPGVVNSSVSSLPLHYSLHTVLVVTSLLMFMPICGPIPEFRLAPAPKMIYLFLQSVVPTVPAAWLTFAEGVVYKKYDIPVRVFGLSVQSDQQLAGAIMKLGGSVYLWTIIGVVFVRHFVRGKPRQFHLRDVGQAAPRGFVPPDQRWVTSAERAAAGKRLEDRVAPASPAAGAGVPPEPVLTFDDVRSEFERTPAPPEPPLPRSPADN